MATDTLPQDTLRAAVLAALKKVIGSTADEGKAALKELMDALEIDSLAARLPDGTKVANLSRAGGSTSARVTDEGKFRTWVTQAHPGETETVVRDSYRKVLLERLDKAGVLADPDTGEVVPGVEFIPGRDYLTLRFAPGGEDAIKAAWQSGRLSLDAMLALPATGGAEAEETASPEMDLTSHLRPPFGDEHGFLSPETAAAHAIVVQGGFTTPPVEAYRMLRGGSVTSRKRAETWLREHGLGCSDPAEGKNTPWPLPEESDE